jgi:CDP-diacylglycerol--serine O-phosphatidyltransferase
MAQDAPRSREVSVETPKVRIYLLPNLLTAGNFFCGFLALTKIVEADLNDPNFHHVIRTALLFILLACICDLLDGRVARMGGWESPFGREFDSLADLISFGVAPAFLVQRIVLRDVFVKYPEVGWTLASIYLICGAMRLARFNCLAAQAGSGGGKEFLGFPIPAAAGLVASLTLFLLWYEEGTFARGHWRYLLPVIMLFLSVMMVSEVKYPAFKSIDWHTKRTFTKMVVTILLIGTVIILRRHILPFVLPVIFTSYLLYGFIRPKMSRRIRHEIEEEDDEEVGEAEVRSELADRHQE